MNYDFKTSLCCSFFLFFLLPFRVSLDGFHTLSKRLVNILFVCIEAKVIYLRHGQNASAVVFLATDRVRLGGRCRRRRRPK